MDTSFFFIMAMIALIFLFVFLFFLARSLKKTSAQLEEVRRAQAEGQAAAALALMQQQIGQLTQQMNQQLQSMSLQFQKTTGDIGQSLGHVQSHLGKVEVVTREVLEKAKTISGLDDLLRAPKFRGGMGEFFLADLLAQILPPSYYVLQHRFKSGEKVDAAIRIGTNLVPVDAKFPLENFRKYIQEEDGKEKEALRRKFVADVKKHVDDIASKYILPDEDTYDFALMYIPAENIYYETILKDEALGEERSLLTFALERRVIPVSPNSFYAYLQVIVLGLKGMRLEKSALSTLQALAQLRGDLDRFRSEFQTLGTHLTNARTRYDEAERRLGKFSDRLELLTEERPAELPDASGERDEDR
ncbi:MAG: DNA recombination protein RmuC [Candidatus Aminicenantes bacterium]|nr:DNA recombination protein RmuC [Candidatus Aminicenantes bacterium]